MPDARQIIFMRELERKLRKVKKEKATAVINDTIDRLYDTAIHEGMGDLSYAYDTLKNKAATANDKFLANQIIVNKIKAEKERALLEHQLALDRVALGDDGYSGDDKSNPFQKLWTNLGLNSNREIIKHHTDVLNAIKKHFEDAEAFGNGGKTPADYTQAYYDARASYYGELEKLHHKNGKIAALNHAGFSYKLGYEKRRIENDIANKKTEQALLRVGLRVAKAFAFAQGVFVGGGTFLLISALLPMMGVVGPALAIGQIVGGIVSAFLFLATTRSNWLTINEEMGPLLKALFFDPALAHLSFWKRTQLWLRRSEVSRKSAINTAKGFTNLLAGAFLGVLTLMGGMGMFGFIPALPMIGTLALGPFGAASMLVIGGLLLLSAVTTFVYFVINNISQKDKNAGGPEAAEDLKRHEKMRAIVNTPKYKFWHHYKKNIIIGLTGVTATLAAASTDIFLSMAPALSGLTTGSFFSFLGTSAFNAIPLAGIIVALSVIGAAYGISSFYQRRTRNATERLIGQEKGLQFEELKGDKLDNMDVTGEKAPDFGNQARVDARNPVRKVIDFMTFPLFNMSVDNSEQARRSNALGQGMPAFMGAWTLGSLSLGFVFSIAAPALLPFAPIFALPIGAILGTTFASWASYSANSAGMRVVNDEITELNILKADQAILAQTVAPNKHLESLGADKADAEFYIESRKRQAANYYGLKMFSTYVREDKVEAAERLIANLDKVVEDPTAQIVNDTNKKSMLHYLYAHQGKPIKRGFNPLDDNGSDLGTVAEHAVEHIQAARRAMSQP